jgi:hypothetical protein
MAWVLTRSLAQLRTDLNTAFPNRDHGSDGTIGDPAHQAETSGHNPDDTFGSRSEYSDNDTKAEVRAFDADHDLRDRRGINMQMVVDKILQTSADRNRLAYIIYNRAIWRKRNGWRKENYTGSNSHEHHAHFSGDPNYDEDNSPWTSILSFKEVPDVDAEQNRRLTNIDSIEYFGNTLGQVIVPIIEHGATTSQKKPYALMQRVNEIQEKVNELAAGGVTQDMLNIAVKAALQDPTVLAALAPVIQENAFKGAQQAERE